jgi:hypothetical protein
VESVLQIYKTLFFSKIFDVILWNNEPLRPEDTKKYFSLRLGAFVARSCLWLCHAVRTVISYPFTNINPNPASYRYYTKYSGENL